MMTDNSDKLAAAYDLPFDGSTFHVEKIIDDEAGLTLFLSSGDKGKQNCSLRFTRYFGYRCFDESDLIPYLKEIGIVNRSGCFVLRESKFINWFFSYSITQDRPSTLYHYVVISADAVIEVLSSEEPELR